MADYHDRWIDCTAEEIRIRGYYFPWGTKRVRYTALKGMRRVAMSRARGQLRIWGTANPGYWASFDPGRPSKQVAFVLDLGRWTKPFVTPDHPDAFEAAVRQRVDLPPDPGPEPGPLV